MESQALVGMLQTSEQYLNRSSECLAEDDSGFAPQDGMMSAAQQLAHIAQTVDWFVDGATRPEGFDLDFEAHAREIAGVSSLAKAREWASRAYSRARDVVGGWSAEELSAPLPDGPVLGGEPRSCIVGGIVEHTAHHRGALTVYARMRGHTPAMPYM